MGKTSSFHGKVVTALTALQVPKNPCHLQV